MGLIVKHSSIVMECSKLLDTIKSGEFTASWTDLEKTKIIDLTKSFTPELENGGLNLFINVNSLRSVSLRTAELEYNAVFTEITKTLILIKHNKPPADDNAKELIKKLNSASDSLITEYQAYLDRIHSSLRHQFLFKRKDSKSGLFTRLFKKAG